MCLKYKRGISSSVSLTALIGRDQYLKGIDVHLWIFESTFANNILSFLSLILMPSVDMPGTSIPRKPLRDLA